MTIEPVITILDFTTAAIPYATAECHGIDPKRPGLVNRVIKDKMHYAILRHGFASVRISKISRACGRQLLRKAHADYLEKSQRYCDIRDAAFVVPKAIEILSGHPADSAHEKLHDKVMAHLAETRKLYAELREIGVLKEDARDIMPEMTETSIVMSGNMQMWWDFFTLRIDGKAQKQIRMIAVAILYAFARLNNIFKLHPKYEECVCSPKIACEFTSSECDKTPDTGR
jgi:flavin-dependent thymidylate synthase